MLYVMTHKNRETVLKALSKLAPTRFWDITVELHKDKRSSTQNARLWALHTAAAEVTGYSAEEMHEFALCRYFGYTTRKIGDLALRFPLKRSSARNVAEFAAFMEATEEWYITEFGVWLPELDGQLT